MSFIDYLASLPAVQLDRLYESHWTCQAVLRWESFKKSIQIPAFINVLPIWPLTKFLQEIPHEIRS